jgi:hypothetical protein
MDFMELKELFLEKNPDYSNDVSNFLFYMQTIREFKPHQQEIMVNGIKSEDIIESLRYYVERGQIKKQAPAKKYFVAIGQLFEYVLNNSNYQNSDLMNELANPSSREKSYKGKTIKFVEKFDMLKPKESFSTLDRDSIDKLTIWCDSVVEKYLGKGERIDDTDFKRIVAALCMKLMILIGITYREARKLKYEDLDPQTNVIQVNGFGIRLPLKLSVQFQNYVRYFNEFVHSDHLFVDIEGNQWGEATTDSGMPNYMKTAIQQTNLTGIVKFGITQLIKSGVNDSVIMKLTGASQELLSSCLHEVQNKDVEWDKYINSKIVTTDYYYML